MRVDGVASRCSGVYAVGASWLRKRKLTHKIIAVFAFARAPREAQEKAHRDAAAPTAKGAPGQPSGAPQAKSPPRAFEDANTPNVPSEENDAASSPRGGVEEGWYSKSELLDDRIGAEARRAQGQA